MIKYQSTQIIRFQVIKDQTIKYKLSHVHDSETTAELLMHTINEAGQNDREQMVAIFLNAKNKVIGTNLVSMGGITSCNVFPQDIVKSALICNATSIVLGHNHPSGNMDLSPDDKHITKRIILAAMMVGITLHDHVILDMFEKGHYSMAEYGYILQYTEEAKKILNNNNLTYQ